MTAWVRHNVDGTQRRIFTLGYEDNIAQQYTVLINESEKIYFISSAAFEPGGQAAVSNSAITSNEWHHVAVTYDGTDLKLFIDGVEDFSNTIGADLPEGSYDYFWIGQRQDGAERWEGELDEISVWSRALSTSDIQGIMYRSMVPDEETGLEGYWRFEENTGSTAYDMSGNGNHAAISGAAWDTDAAVYYPSITLNTTAGTHTNTAPIFLRPALPGRSPVSPVMISPLPMVR